jgi:hypothetical protein
VAVLRSSPYSGWRWISTRGYNGGTRMGVGALARGRRITEWEPSEIDGSAHVRLFRRPSHAAQMQRQPHGIGAGV